MNRRTIIALLLVCFALPYRAFAGETWPTLPMPPKAQVQWVAQHMRVNGAPTRVMQFHSSANREEVVDYYRAHWSGGYDHNASIHTVNDATVVGQKHGPFLMTVTVEKSEGGGSHGLLSVAQIIGITFDRSPGPLALMPDAHVVSVVESEDAGRQSRQIVIIAPQPLASVSRFYEASLTNAGWRPLHDTPIQPARGQTGGRFVVFARDSAEMQLSIVEPRKGAGTTVLANLVTKDTGRGAP
jgi:hypothetical protein